MPPDLTKINPFDFDQKINAFKDHLDSTGAPADQSAALIEKLQSQYKEANQGTQGSSGVLGSGFMSGTFNSQGNSQGETPDMFKNSQAINSGVVLSPLQPGQNRLMGVPKLVPNALSDTGNVAMGIGSIAQDAMSHYGLPVQTIKDIYHDPAMLAGPALNEVFHGVENAVSDFPPVQAGYDLITGHPRNALDDLLKGNFSKSGVDLLSGADKAWTGFVDHPILSLPILGVLGHVSELARDVPVLGRGTQLTDKLGITEAPKIDPMTGKPIAPVTLKQDVQNKMDNLKKIFNDPKTTALSMAQQFVAPFKALMPNKTGDAAANIIADRVKTTLGQINNVDEANQILANKPDFSKNISQIENAQSVVEANKVQADYDLQKAGQEDTALAKGLSNLNAYATDEAIQSTIKSQTDGIKQNYSGNYNNLKAPDGARIPVRETQPLADSLAQFQKDNGAVLDPKTNEALSKYQFILKAQQIIADGGTVKDVSKYVYDSKTPSSYADIYEKLPGNMFDNPLSADQLKTLRDDIVDKLQKGMPSASAMNYVKMFGDATRKPFNDILDNSVNPVNPEGADAIRKANAAFAQLQTLQTRYGLGEDGSFNAGKIETNFQQFKQDFPQAADTYGKMKANESLVFKMSDTGVESLDYARTNKNLEANRQFMSTEQYAQIKSLITKNQRDNMLHGELMDRTNQLSDTLTAAMKETKANESAAPSSADDFEEKVASIKKNSDLNAITKATGLSPSEVGQVFIAKTIKDTFGENVDFKSLSTKDLVAGANKLLSAYDKLGTKKLSDSMFGENKSSIEDMRAEVTKAEEAMKQAGGRSLKRNIAEASAGVIAGILGHIWIASGLILRSARDIVKEKVSEAPAGQTGTLTSRADALGKKIGGAIKAVAPTVGNAAGGQYTFDHYLRAAEAMSGHKYSPDEINKLQEQFDSNTNSNE
jgi:hypothetical protein